MMKQPVEGHNKMYRVNGAFIVNEDDEAYAAALARRKKQTNDNLIEARVTALEGKLDTIIEILLRGNDGKQTHE